jgi:hypothetical protein
MSRLQALAVALRDLADEATHSELENALELCLGFADRISVERQDGEEPIDEPIETTSARRPD